MAKLTANGTEIARYAKERETPDGELTIWERREYSFRSNGKLLKKLTVRFKPDQFDSKGRLHNYGWKSSGTIATGGQQAIFDKLERLNYTKQ